MKSTYAKKTNAPLWIALLVSIGLIGCGEGDAPPPASNQVRAALGLGAAGESGDGLGAPGGRGDGLGAPGGHGDGLGRGGLGVDARGGAMGQGAGVGIGSMPTRPDGASGGGQRGGCAELCETVRRCGLINDDSFRRCLVGCADFTAAGESLGPLLACVPLACGVLRDCLEEGLGGSGDDVSEADSIESSIDD